MRTKWTKTLFWSTLGGAAVGAAAVLVGKRRRSRNPVLKSQRIPEGCTGVVLWTERFEVDEDDGARTVHDTYVLQVTPFKAWSMLDLPSGPEQIGPEGSSIYHVTQFRARDGVEPHQAGEEQVLDRCYGAIDLIDLDGNSCGKNRLARGATLRVTECLVGGSANAVMTGKVHYSAAPILNFRFYYSRAGTQRTNQPAKAS